MAFQKMRRSEACVDEKGSLLHVSHAGSCVGVAPRNFKTSTFVSSGPTKIFLIVAPVQRGSFPAFIQVQQTDTHVVTRNGPVRSTLRNFERLHYLRVSRGGFGGTNGTAAWESQSKPRRWLRACCVSGCGVWTPGAVRVVAQASVGSRVPGLRVD